jgi:hypothetical protein
LTSSVIRWPDAEAVLAAAHRWAHEAAAGDPRVLRIGAFGSYARGDWGVGSDIDLVIIVSSAERPFPERSRDWDASDLPVPADVLVYTAQEWASMRKRRQGITRGDVVWVYGSPEGPPGV